LWEIGIHISDVSALISSNSDLDKEAKQIGESLYIKNTLVKPLFPADIYSGVCSLKEGEDRLAISLFIVMNEEGIIDTDTIEFRDTVIRNKRRIDYKKAQSLIVGEAQTDEDQLLQQKLRVLNDLMNKRRQLRDQL
jgi:exoribonuclease R